MNRTSGGYVTLRHDLIRVGTEPHTAALSGFPVSDAHLAALNAVQATPYRINRFVLETLEWAWEQARWHGMSIPGVSMDKEGRPLNLLPAPLPPRLSDEVWATMDKDARKASLQARGAIHAANARVIGHVSAFLDVVMVARELADREAIWFPHTMDFRGRLYPLAVNGPQPQGNDVSKACLEFAEGKPLGPDGLYWLCVRAANCYGMDKLPLEERVQWTLDNLWRFNSCVVQPFRPWWADAAEPWQFLATCKELVAVDMEHPEDFISHLPIPLDGSCNGLQHLSAMGLDPVGAKATNLAGGERQDIYEDVAALVIAAVTRDAAAGVPGAIGWVGRVTRKTVKRAVMTTPYGVTDNGIRTQLIADKHIEGLHNPRKKSAEADYMRDAIIEALEGSIGSARRIMAWLQDTAAALAKAGLPFEWTTPIGTRCRQAYHQVNSKQIVTLGGRYSAEETSAILDSRKQSLGSAPNYVHSFDASHMALTVNAAVAGGVTDFSMIHDSFGTHACNTTALGRILREQFVAIYDYDWLADLGRELAGACPHVELPELPLVGLFDLNLVLDAPFFFS